MNLINRIGKLIQRLLPSPMSIAILLTLLSMVLAVLVKPEGEVYSRRFVDVLGFWNKGFWSLMEFTMQMVLILLLGYVLALSRGVEWVVARLSMLVNSSSKAVVLIALTTLLVSFFNWGLGLVFGAVLARKMAESFALKGQTFNYALFGAAAYSGMMVWHGGLSGSAPLKVAESGHFLAQQLGQIPLSDTIFSNLNIFVSFALLLLIPLFFYFINRKSKQMEEIVLVAVSQDEELPQKPTGIERLDYARWFSLFFAVLILLIPVFTLLKAKDLSFLNLNYINTLLLGLALLAHGSIRSFLKAVEKAIGSTSGIIIQFPLYAGIMGIMKYSGLYLVFTNSFVQLANAQTLPFFTMLSAGLVNVFVPSGGGQWIIQGPIVAEAANVLGVSVPKSIMAFAYGDELTNMIQPFWALPLLGITGLKAKNIFPFSFFLMLLGILVFSLGLLLF